MIGVSKQEKLLERACTKTYKKKGYLVHSQVPFFRRLIDIYALNPVTGDTVAIEAKVGDWKQAVRQARSCLLCADKVYIALPSQICHRVDREYVGTLGIGVLSVLNRDECVEHLPARESDLRIQAFLDKVLSATFPNCESTALLLVKMSHLGVSPDD